jgi:hypothetical protein
VLIATHAIAMPSRVAVLVKRVMERIFPPMQYVSYNLRRLPSILVGAELRCILQDHYNKKSD